MQGVLLVAVLAFLVAGVHTQYDPDCQDGPPGVYCLSDLSGYLNCSIDHGVPVNQRVQCPSITRCKCFVRNACEDGSPCDVFASPDPWPQTFTMTYVGKQTVTGPFGPRTTNMQGMWRRDEVLRKYVKWDWLDDAWLFHLVAPNDQGAFDEFVGSYETKSCIKSRQPSLPELEISKFTYAGNAEVGGVLAESWEFLIGARNPGESAIRTTWYSVYDNEIKAHRPARFVEKVSASVSSRTSSFTQWDVGVFADNAGGDDWFRVPEQCQ